MSYLVANPEDRFSHGASQSIAYQRYQEKDYTDFDVYCTVLAKYESRAASYTYMSSDHNA